MKDKIIEYLKENTNVIKEIVTECNCYDGSLEDFYYYDNDEEFFELFKDRDDLVRAISYGDYNYMDDYVRLNAYGNAESCDEYELEAELVENVEEIVDTFLELYQDNVTCYDDGLKELLEEGEANE